MEENLLTNTKKGKNEHTNEKIYFIEFIKFRKFLDPEKIFFNRTLVISINCSSCSNNRNRIFKEESIEILKNPW